MSCLAVSTDVRTARADFCTKVERANLSHPAGVFDLLERLCPAEHFLLNDSTGRGLSITRHGSEFSVNIDLSGPRDDVLTIKSYKVSSSVVEDPGRQIRTNPAAVFETPRYRTMLNSELLAELASNLHFLTRAMRER